MGLTAHGGAGVEAEVKPGVCGLSTGVVWLPVGAGGLSAGAVGSLLGLGDVY